VPRVYHSRNHHSSVVVGYFHRRVAPGPTAVRLAREFRSFPGVQVGGSALAAQEVTDQTKSDVTAAEIAAAPLLLLLGLFAFRSAMAALLPVIATLIALSLTFCVLELVNLLYPVSILSLDLVVSLTVGLSLDYSLLLVSRYREELGHADTPLQAALITILSAGRTVAISSATIAVAFASPFVFPIPFLRSLAIGGTVAAIIAGLVSLAVLPAVLALLGHRINRFAVPASRPSRLQFELWRRIARHVVARPLLAVVSSACVLLVLGAFAFGVRLTGFDASALPANASSRRFDERIQSEFARPLLDEVVVAAQGDARTIGDVIAPAVERLPGVKAGVVTHLRGALWTFSIKPTGLPFSGVSQRLVRDIRELPFHLAVTGTTANYLDTRATLEADLPLAVFPLLCLTLLLLFFATGSIVLPVVAVAVNTLSLASAVGLLVLVFQDGRFTGLLDYRGLGAIILTQPVLLAAGAFGVVTDYGVFLLTRISETKATGLPSSEAVSRGLERTGPIISSAALLFCVAVGALVTAKMIFVKELGFGIVAAVVIDVTVVRALLLPGLIILLGRWSWWRPRWLRPSESAGLNP
jgi:uncharacterized membrane protein YdfJ with MMPL/SSD domain